MYLNLNSSDCFGGFFLSTWGLCVCVCDCDCDCWSEQIVIECKRRRANILIFTAGSAITWIDFTFFSLCVLWLIFLFEQLKSECGWSRCCCLCYATFAWFDRSRAAAFHFRRSFLLVFFFRCLSFNSMGNILSHFQYVRTQSLTNNNECLCNCFAMRGQA